MVQSKQLQHWWHEAEGEIFCIVLAFDRVSLCPLFSTTFPLPEVAHTPSALLAVGEEELYSALYSLSLLGTCCWLSPGHCIHLSALQCCLCLPPHTPPSFSAPHTQEGCGRVKHSCTHTCCLSNVAPWHTQPHRAVIVLRCCQNKSKKNAI